MGQFFGSIYCIFEDFFGLELADYLWGTASPYSTSNTFIGIGLWMFGISFVVALIFYYGVDKPKLNTWWGWGLFLVVNAVINFLVGWQYVLKDYYADMMMCKDPATNDDVSLNIDMSNLLCFGVSNMLLSIAVFVIISFMVKWRSNNCSNAPI